MSRRNSAFTLVELLVVLTIIAIIAGLIVAVIRSVRRSAQQTVCASNQRQIGVAMQLHIQDFRALPSPIIPWNWPMGHVSAGISEPLGPAVGAAQLVIEGYLDTSKALYCPASKNITQGQHWRPSDWTQTYLSYCWWAGYTCGFGGTPDGIVRKIHDSSNAVLCTDYSTVTDHNASLPGNHIESNGITFGGNILYHDGHVAWKPFSGMKLEMMFNDPIHFAPFYY